MVIVGSDDDLASASDDPSHAERDHDDQAHCEQGGSVEIDVEAGRDHDQANGVQRAPPRENEWRQDSAARRRVNWTNVESRFL